MTSRAQLPLSYSSYLVNPVFLLFILYLFSYQFFFLLISPPVFCSLTVKSFEMRENKNEAFSFII